MPSTCLHLSYKSARYISHKSATIYCNVIHMPTSITQIGQIYWWISWVPQTFRVRRKSIMVGILSFLRMKQLLNDLPCYICKTDQPQTQRAKLFPLAISTAFSVPGVFFSTLFHPMRRDVHSASSTNLPLRTTNTNHPGYLPFPSMLSTPSWLHTLTA